MRIDLVQRLLLAICVCLSHAAIADELQKPDPGKRIKVFILAGQSNMEGRADGNKLNDEDRERLEKVQDRVQLAFNNVPPRPLNVVKPSDEIARIYERDLIFGPELFFGIAMAEAWPEDRILLIKLSAGGTSLHGAWNPNWQHDKAALMEEENNAQLYGALTEYVDEILSGYEPDEYELGAMLWVQGESDGSNKTAAAAYGDNLAMLVSKIRQDLNREELPFIMFQVGRNKVVEGMRRVSRDVPGVTLIPQSQDPISLDFYEKMENGHYNYAGMKKLGTRFAQVYLHHIFFQP